MSRGLATAGCCVLVSAALMAQQPAPGAKPAPTVQTAQTAQTAPAALTLAQIEKPAADSWPTYNGDYSGRRFSTLTKITAANVKNISLAWLYDLPAAGTIKVPIRVAV